MDILIHAVQPGSIAEALNLVPGDQIIELNARRDLEDLFDYQFEVLGTETVSLWVKHVNGEETVFDIEKEPDEDLGLHFQSPLFTPIKTCNNACPFCFIDQQPEGLRASLYVKDDDYRLSYFHNTYITLTNLTPHDRKRIELIRPGPLYVSVHATRPEVRERLLQNQKQAGHIMKELSWLKSLDIPFHCQVVLCPGINDGDVLAETLQDLSTLRPEALSVAVVPVGLTQHRGNLPELTPVTPAVARQTIEIVNQANRISALDDPFVYLSDEFYLMVGEPLPSYEAYGDFPQLDDGVGTARLLLQEFHNLENTLPTKISPDRKLLVMTGKLASMTLQPIVARLNQIEGLFIDILTVESAFWGRSVDVAGLITGKDLLTSTQGHNLNGYDWAIIPSVMLKQGTQLFLDDETVESISQQMGLTIKVVENPYSAKDFLGTLF